MSDWIEHDGGPQPVADDVWVERPNSSRRIGPAHWFDWTVKGQFRVLNQHLIDAARLEGIRLGLEAADKAIKELYVEWPANAWRNALEDASMDVRNLKPDTIAREAKPTA
ncbi:MAG: hypothetical protein IOD05_17860 [Rhodobacter sp.]|nr:hypothetical protein [Rhodobacter sp.]